MLIVQARDAPSLHRAGIKAAVRGCHSASITFPFVLSFNTRFILPLHCCNPYEIPLGLFYLSCSRSFKFGRIYFSCTLERRRGGYLLWAPLHSFMLVRPHNAVVVSNQPESNHVLTADIKSDGSLVRKLVGGQPS